MYLFPSPPVDCCHFKYSFAVAVTTCNALPTLIPHDDVDAFAAG